MSTDKVKVLYIAGVGRSGTTILGDVLGQINGFFHVGELLFMGYHLLRYGRLLCGCGVPLQQCELWSNILQKALGPIDSTVLIEMFRLRNKCARVRHLPLLLFPGGASFLEPQLSTLTINLERLYSTIRDVAGCRLIVDSSKNPHDAYILSRIPSIALYVVHLVRDPRATVYSWKNRKKFNPAFGKRVYSDWSQARLALDWGFTNFEISFILGQSYERYLLVRYEDFVSKPKDVIESILDMVGERSDVLPLVEERKVELATNHTVSGNPSRFERGTVKLTLDQEWKTKMTGIDRFIVTALTWPLLFHYRYPLLGGRTVFDTPVEMQDRS